MSERDTVARRDLARRVYRSPRSIALALALKRDEPSTRSCPNSSALAPCPLTLNPTQPKPHRPCTIDCL
ncbi:hypothetical protein GWI33_002579 [Rhynchophorus ferrugineus]|uniref:Uncharacterized protein n=1 Tax=Rhynchophorus ferrugineus TaxID=354439 RepID=A0A834IMF3_RHYFE|nr:hypothetical protein GWI33_002579 [Rhynchophorus ferrugineus]